ncbi:MAG: alanine--tRNA ligase [Candidatus Omnitrophota bacterium]
MTGNEIRNKYLKFFEFKKHRIVQSDSLVPANDPSVLFTSAGMSQFKEQFMGLNITFKRAASSQKCLRTGDLEKVGKTAGHHTFFEMLGNFSFGDYFKKEAIAWAWEFMTTELKIPAEKLWVSVYKDDDDAYNIWKNDIKIPARRIKRYGADDNFWPQNAISNGPDGPCGPSSEIFYDRGEDAGCKTKHCEPSCSCGRFVEVWNLVFTQFNRAGKNNIIPLKNKNIDTGMGLERIASVTQGVRTNFETDLFIPITDAIYGLSESGDKGKVNAIADHMRAAVFMISDGVLPSNEERGYVCRMLIRRAFTFGKELGIEAPFLYKLAQPVARVMKEPYPEIETMRENIADVILNEEKRFEKTLAEGERIIRGKKIITAEDLFNLYDTCGVPFGTARRSAEKKGIPVEKGALEGAEEFMERQRELARSKSKMSKSIFDDSKSEDTIKKLSESLKKTVFLGYSGLETGAKVLAIVKGGSKVKSAKSGDKAEIILDETPFYGESGGQIGDSGEITGRYGKARVLGTKKVGNVIVHIAEITKGEIKEGSSIKALVDKDARLDIARNHTATHLLHYALREVLGKHVKQSGSLVAKERLRFDFTHFKAVDKRELDRIEEIVNELIRENIKVKSENLSQRAAKKRGAIALFGEKYGKKVRMISVGECSRELCGGTHLDYTGQIGLFRIVSEGSVASGMRRIEAITGRRAQKSVRDDEELISDTASLLKTTKADLKKAAEEAMLKARSLTREGVKKNKAAALDIEGLIAKSEDMDGIKVVSADIANADIAALRDIADDIKRKAGLSLVVLGSSVEGKVSLVCSVSDKAVAKGLDAGNIIKKVALIVGGSGGGRPTFAQAGGRDVNKLKEALREALNIVRGEIKK